ncbi:MAG: sigma 54-interacting transcriptional regulator [Firmicutes bacterium]|nr:sigma 54-interacting transcriptional regulator [Bacillota bacterium]
MATKEELMLKKADYVLVVNKDFDIIYNSRFDPRMGNKSDLKEYKNLFEMYPSLGKNNSSIAKTMSTGATVFNDAQEFADINGRVYVTQNLTIPIFREGQVVGVVELTKDLTTVGDIQGKSDYLKSIKVEGKFHPNRESNDKISFDDILTINDRMLDAIEKAKVFALNNNPVLIYGETGTGKEMFAQAMINYAASPKQKTIIQNCAAVPENLIESILFGTTKGSYTGAENKKGLFEEADGGIFFLDELNALPYHVQGKLLRVVQEGTFRPIGANREKKVNVKIVAAMNVDPMEAIDKMVLRKDLFYRLSGNMIYLPPLRERKDDIEYLIDNYIDYFNDVYGKNVKGISEELRSFFLEYEWEGNVRELKHVIESMISMTKVDILQFSELPVYLHGKMNGSGKTFDSAADSEDSIVTELKNGGYDLRSVVEQVERDLILKVLSKTKGNKTKAGEILGIPRQTLKYKMSKLGIEDIEK